MRRYGMHLAFCAFLVLSACARTNTEQTALHSSAVSSMSSSSSVVAWNEYLHREYRFMFRYPEFAGDISRSECIGSVPLKVYEVQDRIVLAQQYVLDSDCKTPLEPTNDRILEEDPLREFSESGAYVGGFGYRTIGGYLNIFVFRLNSPEDILPLIQRIYHPYCRLGPVLLENAERLDVKVEGDPQNTESTAICNDIRMLFNPKTGVLVTFSIPGGSAMFPTSDHLGAYDRDIAESFRFVP